MNIVNCDWTSNDPGIHPLRVVDAPVLDKDCTVTCSVGNTFYESITLEDLFNSIPIEEEENNGYVVKDVRNPNNTIVTILDSTHSMFSPNIRKFKGMSDEELLKKGMAKVNFITKCGDKISVTTDTFTHNYSKSDGKNYVYSSEYLTGEPYDPDAEMATMGAIDPNYVITYSNWGVNRAESIGNVWKRMVFSQNPITVSKDSEYIDTPGMLIFDTSSNKYVKVKRMTHNNDMGRWYKISFGDRSLYLTEDHPLPTNRGRVEAQNLKIGDEVPVSSLNQEPNSVVTVTAIEYIGYRGVDEYDVETESDKFDFEFINSHNCRTMIGYDRHGMGYKKTGRGNVAPVTMILPKLGIEYGICLGERKEADVEGFFKAFDTLLDIAEKSLVDRFNYVCSQNPRAGWFMYENSSIADGDKVLKSGKIYDAMKHGTLALGYIGIANTCYAMFGKYHHEDPEVMKFADRIIVTIKKRADEASERHDLNFSTYSTPAESACYTICKNLQKEYGKIKGVTDEEFLTNSLHIPVFSEVSIKNKLDIEAQLAKYSTGGEINYIELESSVVHNHKAVETIIHYAMRQNIPYLAINFPIDTCQDCGSRVEEFAEKCHKCGSTNIQSLRRVTGYLTTDYRRFNNGKVREVLVRFRHSKKTNFADLTK